MNFSTVKKSLSIFLISSAACGFSATSTSAANQSPKPPLKQIEKPVVVTEKVNINRASATEIASALKGIGLKKAQAIVEWRKANGKFTQIEQLMAIKGIAEKTLEKNKLYIQL